MQGEVQTFALHFAGDAQSDDRIDDLQQDQRDYGVVHDHDGYALDLVDHLARVAFDQAGGATILGDREHAGQQCADHATYALDAKAVERVVRTEDPLEARGAPVAENAGGDADHHRTDGADIARGRGDGDEAGDGARADADDGGFAACNPLNQHPGESRDRSCDLGHGHRHARLHAGGDGGSGVETEPANPQQRGADEGEHHVVRRADFFAFAEHDGAHQTGNARIDMHDRTASEVEHLEHSVVIAI